MRILLLLSALFFSGMSIAVPVKKLVVFGDSLSDNGNLYEYMEHRIPVSPPYFGGRFSNGPVWDERLMDIYFPNHGHMHLLNYAFGGAGVSEEDDDVVFTLKREIDSYLLAHQDKADPESLYVVWIGANNYLGLPEDHAQAVNQVEQGISNGLRRLANAGAKQILLINTPDLSKAPIAVIFDAKDALADFTQRHNDAIERIIGQMQKEFQQVKWIKFDVNALLNDVFDNPEKYDVKNVTDTCYESGVDKFSKRPILNMATQIQKQARQDQCEGYLFFDPVHPVARAHQAVAEKVKEVLDAQGIEFKHQSDE